MAEDSSHSPPRTLVSSSSLLLGNGNGSSTFPPPLTQPKTHFTSRLNANAPVFVPSTAATSPPSISATPILIIPPLSHHVHTPPHFPFPVPTLHSPPITTPVQPLQNNNYNNPSSVPLPIPLPLPVPIPVPVSPPQNKDSQNSPPPQNNDSKISPPPQNNESKISPPPQNNESKISPPPQKNESSGALDSEISQSSQKNESNGASGSKTSPPPQNNDSKSSPADQNLFKILNMVEYYFSDINLATTSQLWKHIVRDPEGYVPINLLAELPKIQALVTDPFHLAAVLASSSKLTLSKNAKRVKRNDPVTEADLEAIQSCIVYAPNVHHLAMGGVPLQRSLMKIFSSVGKVRSIRISYPTVTSKRSYAYAEYETVEMAEKAVEELNKTDNKSNDLRIQVYRLTSKLAYTRARIAEQQKLQARKENNDTQPNVKKLDHGNNGKHSRETAKRGHEEDDNRPKSQPNLEALEKKAQKADEVARKDEASSYTEDEKKANNEAEDWKKAIHEKLEKQWNIEDAHEDDMMSSEVWNKDCWNRRGGAGHGKTKFCNFFSSRSSNIWAPPSNNPICNVQASTAVNQPPPGPRMPDGTRGFTMGRGKPLAVSHV